MDLPQFRRHRGYGVTRHDTSALRVLREPASMKPLASSRGPILAVWGNTKVAAPLAIVDPSASEELASSERGGARRCRGAVDAVSHVAAQWRSNVAGLR